MDDMVSATTLIRQASADDLPQVLVWTLALHQHEDDASLPMHPNFSDNLQRWLKLELENPNNLFLIAENQQQPAGFISARTVINDNGFLADPVKGVINLIWVDSQHRNQQIATQLLEQAELCLAAVGVTYIECSYTATNLLARQFWDNKNYFPAAVTARKQL